MRLRIFDSRPALSRAAAEHVGALVAQAVGARGFARLALPGGSFVRPIYAELGLLQVRWEKVAFYFTDERGVPPDHPASNYGEALDRLFTNPRIELFQVHRIEGEGADLEAVAELYERELPEQLDVALLGLEADGTIAALSPGSPAFDDERRVVPVTSPKKPRRRVTLGPDALAAVDELCVVAAGRAVASALREAREDGPVEACPGRLARRGAWFVDRAAAAELAR